MDRVASQPTTANEPDHRGARSLPPAPLIDTYRHRLRSSLRWRLAQSHVATILISVAAISLVGALAAVAVAVLQKPMAEEPAREAEWVAEGLSGLGWVDELVLPVPPDRVSSPAIGPDDEATPDPARQVAAARTKTAALLEAMASGRISPNVYTEDINLRGFIGRRLANVSSISIVGPDLTILASSEPILNGRNAMLISPTSLGVAQSALSGNESARANTRIAEAIGSITGAFPLRDSSGEIVGAVVVDKSARTLPTGWSFVLLVLAYVGKVTLLLALLIGLPAIPIGTVIGIRRARAISQPITELAAATDAIADQRLDARVRVVGEDEIAALGRRFNEMADRLEESLTREAAARARAESLLAANKELVANVSHELRTPVALVRAHLESLASEPERIEEYARIALRETDRLESLVNDLFQLARLETAGTTLEREPFDAGAAAREATESLIEPARREAGIMMQTAVAGSPGELYCTGDRARLIQVLQNLIRNAIRHTPEGGIILVDARPDGDAVVVTVRDTGVGIAPEDLPHVFERFYRGERSRNRSHGGAGLGLAMARQLIEAMGGTIAVYSELGEGTLFTIRLPRVVAPANGVAPQPAPAAVRA